MSLALPLRPCRLNRGVDRNQRGGRGGHAFQPAPRTASCVHAILRPKLTQMRRYCGVEILPPPLSAPLLSLCLSPFAPYCPTAPLSSTSILSRLHAPLPPPSLSHSLPLTFFFSVKNAQGHGPERKYKEEKRRSDYGRERSEKYRECADTLPIEPPYKGRL